MIRSSTVPWNAPFSFMNLGRNTSLSHSTRWSLKRDCRSNTAESHTPQKTTHSWNWTLFEKPPIVHLLKNFPAFYGARRCITVFSSPLLVPILSQLSPYHPILSLRSILILSTHLRLVFLVVPFHLAFPPISCMHSSPRLCYMPCPSHPPWLDHSNYTWRRVQVTKFLIM
jgi:hypothetical protein